MQILINSEAPNPPPSSIPCHYNYYHHILNALGYPQDKPPVADLLRQLHGLKGKWIIATPVYWSATHNDAMIVASGNTLFSNEEESLQCFEAFNVFLDGEMEVFYHDANHWLLRYDEKPEVNAKPLSLIYHRSLMPELEGLDKHLFWQRLITECQMFFNSPATNTKENKINGLWFWGNGEYETSSELVFYDEASQKLAGILTTQPRPYPFVKGNYPKSANILMEQSSLKTLPQLEKQLKNKPAHWYWNNACYVTKTKSWWSRLWR